MSCVLKEEIFLDTDCRRSFGNLDSAGNAEWTEINCEFVLLNTEYTGGWDF